MTTKLIGIKKFRENITNIWKKSQKEKIRYIVMYHSFPVFEVNPICDKDVILDNLMKDIKKARAQIKKGEIYSEEEVYKKLGIE